MWDKKRRLYNPINQRYTLKKGKLSRFLLANKFCKWSILLLWCFCFSWTRLYHSVTWWLEKFFDKEWYSSLARKEVCEKFSASLVYVSLVQNLSCCYLSFVKFFKNVFLLEDSLILLYFSITYSSLSTLFCSYYLWNVYPIDC